MPSPYQTRQIARQIGGPTYNPTNITAAKTLTSSDDGQIWNVTQGSGYTIDLPLLSTISAGWNATFHLQVAGSGTVVVQVNDTDDGKMYGLIIDINATTPTYVASAEDRMNFLNAAVITDRIYCEYDGLNWFVLGTTGADTGITATQD